MLLYSLFSITVVLLPTVTHQCAPHTVSKPWTQTSNVNHHHHHQTVENFYLDNRTIYNKIVEIEKRIEKIEEKEKTVTPLEPQKPIEPEIKPDPKPAPQPEPEDPGQDCLSCASQPPIMDSCENCLPVTVSPPFEYYACKAIEVQCGDGAKKFKISEKTSKYIIENKFMLECRKGSWILMENRKEHHVEEISCLKI